MLSDSAADACPDLHQIAPDSPAYPIGLRTCPAFKTAPTLCCLGNLDLLQRPTVALFCSRNCPEDLMPAARQIVQTLRASDLLPISGFHTPIEQDWLKELLGNTPLIHCPARSLHKLPLSPLQIQAIRDRRLLLLSPFPASAKRATANLATKRNALIASLASAAIIAYAAPNSHTAALAQALIQAGKPVFTLESHHNRVLLEMEVQVISAMPDLQQKAPSTPE